MDKPIEILYIDNHLLILNKPSGILVQGDRSGDVTLLELARRYIKEHYKKPGDVFLGLVHRLDRPVSGIVLFARTSKAAARISEIIRLKQFTKTYHALVEGKAPQKDKFVDFLCRENRRAVICHSRDGKYSELSFKRLRYDAGISEVEIRLKTGRYHQIRAQFSSRNLPIVGDHKYGSKVNTSGPGIALHAKSLTFIHPVRDELLTVTSKIDSNWAQQILLG